MSVHTPVRTTTADAPRPSGSAVTTYRYLRVAMVLLLSGIGASVAVEWWHQGRTCLQGSISAYYYTPARAFFVSAVLALGVCLVALRGSSWWEETSLNLAGMFAPVVALVPTPNVGACTSDPALQAAGPDAVFNNMAALFLLAPLCLAYVALLVALAVRQGKVVHLRAPVSVVVPAGLAWASALTVFVADRDLFLEQGHNAAALLMFGCIVLVVALNGRAFGCEELSRGQASGNRAFFNRYSTIAVVMVGSLVVMFAARLATGWEHWVFTVEITLLALFAVFWTLQTEELWDQGLRQDRERGTGTAEEALTTASPR